MHLLSPVPHFLQLFSALSLSVSSHFLHFFLLSYSHTLWLFSHIAPAPFIFSIPSRSAHPVFSPLILSPLCLLSHFTSFIRCVHPDFPSSHPTASPRPSFPSVPHSHSLSLQKQPVNLTPTSSLLSQHHSTTHVSALSLSSL